MSSENVIDLRSDTVTRPTPPMLEAMFSAKVGDDLFGEDPTVRELEELSASLFGKEAALYCASGTMANQIALKVMTQPQDEIICDQLSHIYYYEGGGPAFISGVSLKIVQGDRGRLTPEDVIDHINPDNIYQTRTTLVSLENTHNKGGGSYYRPAQLEAVSAAARSRGLGVHLDGARIFNALTETGQSPESIGRLTDTMTFCLSKGLGAPVGSMLLSTKENIRYARRIRKALGGTMRQAGYIAAAGIYALRNNIRRLKTDHERAARIAEFLKRCSYVEELLPVETNIIVFKLAPSSTPEHFLHYLSSNGVLAVQFGKQTIRMVTHLDVDDAGIGKVCQLITAYTPPTN